jgi:ribosomal-protein-alanine N-acetyltransferase
MELSTERLVLREFIARDWAAVHAYHNDPRYQRFYESEGSTPEQAQAFVQMFLDQQAAQPRTKFQLALTLKATGQLIGTCGIRMSEPGARQADIGYELAPEHWGRGYATEAARAIMAFGFSELNVHRIWSWCISENHGSAAVLRRLGMRQEGHLRENEYFKGSWWDTLMFGMLDREWQP